MDDFRFLWGSVLLQLWHSRRRIPVGKTAPRSGDTQMSPSSMYHRSARPPFFFNACRGSSAPMNFPGPPNWKLAVSCYLTEWSAGRRFGCEGSSEPIHERLPDACWAVTRPRVSAATIPRAGLHSRVTVDVSFFCTTIFGHWRQPLLLTRERSFDVSTPPPPQCARGETGTPLRSTVFHSIIPEQVLLVNF